MRFDLATVAFLAVGTVLLAGAVFGASWFGPGWWVLAGIGTLFVLAGLAMAYERED